MSGPDYSPFFAVMGASSAMVFSGNYLSFSFCNTSTAFALSRKLSAFEAPMKLARWKFLASWRRNANVELSFHNAYQETSVTGQLPLS